MFIYLQEPNFTALRILTKTKSNNFSHQSKLQCHLTLKGKQRENIFTSRPKNLPIDANRCRILLLLKLIKTSAAVMLP
jgi:hypothetical protein